MVAKLIPLYLFFTIALKDTKRSIEQIFNFLFYLIKQNK